MSNLSFTTDITPVLQHNSALLHSSHTGAASEEEAKHIAEEIGGIVRPFAVHIEKCDSPTNTVTRWRKIEGGFSVWTKVKL